MVNFSVQINYLVLVFVTFQVVAWKVFKPSNETQNELDKTGTTNLLPFDSHNPLEISKGRDSYSYYYGKFRLGKNVLGEYRPKNRPNEKVDD